MSAGSQRRSRLSSATRLLPSHAAASALNPTATDPTAPPRSKDLLSLAADITAKPAPTAPSAEIDARDWPIGAHQPPHPSHLTLPPSTLALGPAPGADPTLLWRGGAAPPLPGNLSLLRLLERREWPRQWRQHELGERWWWPCRRRRRQRPRHEWESQRRGGVFWRAAARFLSACAGVTRHTLCPPGG